mmetsp:Transcript_12142/g.21436  ORF Transcript_12142/g.21436 Transcript_12142/m.21436 type:complete len:114 (+) Transcript_12142:306-647(+)
MHGWYFWTLCLVRCLGICYQPLVQSSSFVLLGADTTNTLHRCSATLVSLENWGSLAFQCWIEHPSMEMRLGEILKFCNGWEQTGAVFVHGLRWMPKTSSGGLLRGDSMVTSCR